MLLLRPISAIGSRAIGLLEFIGGLGYLLADTAASAGRGLFSRRGRRMGWRSLWFQMVRVGVRSIPIVVLVLFCVGAILALQMSPILKSYGAESQVARIIAVATFRELGPLISAIVLTGFAGASIAAEIGTMVVSEELEALEAEAINPIRFLVLPRVVATAVMMICVAVVGDLMGVAGGLFVSHAVLDLNLEQYLRLTFEAPKVRDFVTGLIKAGVFGTLISTLACYLGLGVTGGAQGVGVATTRTVVLTIVALIMVDLMFTGAFYYFGW
ncbi:MAG: putative transporter permease protein, partial [Phycisphaerales bacterium]|jgi:phospholipid/cholesterol/gamma-HCH transport system permease protein|nr:putative transporter permease protein [Phycisphaerales bacterium]MDB5354649.1 putative transporter permease protein [Phycisphaerales bacterium]